MLHLYKPIKINNMKTLDNTTANQAKDQVKDIKFWGDGDTFKLISKASSINEGWMKSTKAMEIPGVGCVVQVTTQQNIYDEKLLSPSELKALYGENYPAYEKVKVVTNCSIAEAVTFVPGVKIAEEINTETGIVEFRRLVAI